MVPTLRFLARLAAFCAVAVALSACATADGDWQTAQRTGTSDAYETFLRKWPGATTAPQARTRLAELRAEEAWRRAVARNTSEAYRDFVGSFPASTWVAEARQRQRQLDADRAWQRASTTNTITALEQFLQSHAASQQAAEAKQRLQVLRDELAERQWQTASSANTIPALQGYLRAHAASPRATEARERVVSLLEQQERVLLPKLQASIANARELASLPVNPGDFANNILVQASGSLLTYQGARIMAPGIPHGRIPSRGQVWNPIERVEFRVIVLGAMPTPADLVAHTERGAFPLGYVIDAFGVVTVAVPREIVPFELELVGLMKSRLAFKK